ncbi:two-component system response regulator [Denitratisoma sp. DHT3]|uniref:response regulator n=1 Tax=Denitratisoma sp. DHT3 TaxID=1981880 RepID=UPI0011983096|nr:HD domain-containing phosphohydrolase [Denitratisoma sp. DHT3]QDX82359.1 two-component system response regulator [Denitratisoma sp. DHT3]
MAYTILVVDDEPGNLALLRGVLAAEYSLVFARSGSEALAATAKHHPDLILLDVLMPDMDGYTVCRKLKENPESANIPVIFVTGLSEVGDETTGFSAGAVDYITKPISPVIVRARVRAHISLVSAKQLEQSYLDAINMLGQAGEFKDSHTGLHIWRMAAYSAELASASGWDETSCEHIRLAAPMHDIGKIGIPDAILCKPGKLDAEEWSTMQTHSTIGHKILSRSQVPILQLAATIVHCHHEKWDGNGYPRHLAGEAIPEVARIVAIADVFDALTMRRPYKEAWHVDRVFETMIAETGTHFEPRLMNLFVDITPRILAIKDEWGARESRLQHRTA